MLFSGCRGIMVVFAPLVVLKSGLCILIRGSHAFIRSRSTCMAEACAADLKASEKRRSSPLPIHSCSHRLCQPTWNNSVASDRLPAVSACAAASVASGKVPLQEPVAAAAVAGEGSAAMPSPGPSAYCTPLGCLFARRQGSGNTRQTNSQAGWLYCSQPFSR